MQERERHSWWRGLPPEKRYETLVVLWTHHSSTQLQWPSIVLSAILVTLSLASSVGAGELLLDPKKWGNEAAARSFGLLLLVVGGVSMVMLYVMARARHITKLIERELAEHGDSIFRALNHPEGGTSGARLIWRFMALLTVTVASLGAFLLIGLGSCCGVAVIVVILTWTPWIALCSYGWNDAPLDALPNSQESSRDSDSGEPATE